VERLRSRPMGRVHLRRADDPFVFDGVVVAELEGDRDAGRDARHARLEVRVAERDYHLVRKGWPVWCCR
jgi:hypothetical protein